MTKVNIPLICQVYNNICTFLMTKGHPEMIISDAKLKNNPEYSFKWHHSMTETHSLYLKYKLALKQYTVGY